MIKNLSDEFYLHLLNKIQNIGYATLRKVKSRFNLFETAWKYGNAQTLAACGFSSIMIEDFFRFKKECDYEVEIAALNKAGIVLFSAESKEYPPLLKQIPDPPFMLYRRGEPLNDMSKYTAIVGSRMPSPYGIRFGKNIARSINEFGSVVVSGLAFGIDAVAHQTAVDMKRPTVAVLASGVDMVTPRSNNYLADAILFNGGSIISEYPNNSNAYKYRFVARNRIISGMCASTIVIEAGEKSGALITARHAFDQDRNVFALMGDIDRPQAKGCLNLMANHIAEPICDLERIPFQLGLNEFDNHIISKDADSKKIYSAVEAGKFLSFEELASVCKMPAGILNACLIRMELMGIIKVENGKWRLA
jgi:DNA processing protein